MAEWVRLFLPNLHHVSAFRISSRCHHLWAQLKNIQTWSSLVEGGKGSYLPNCQTTLVIALDALFLLFFIFINTTAYHLGRYEPSPPSTQELHELAQSLLFLIIEFDPFVSKILPNWSSVTPKTRYSPFLLGTSFLSSRYYRGLQG